MIILNTRPESQHQQLNQMIVDSGHSVIHLPTLQITPTPTTWISSMPDLSQLKYAIFTSANAVKYYFTVLAQYNISWSDNIHVIAIGKATAQILEKYNIITNSIPEQANSESLLDLPCLQHINQQQILLVKGTTGRDLITTVLKQKNAILTTLEVYQTCIPNYTAQQLDKIKFIDLIIYTSKQGMYNLFTLLGKDAHNWLCNIPSIVISQRLYQIAKCLGIKDIEIKGLDNDSYGKNYEKHKKK